MTHVLRLVPSPSETPPASATSPARELTELETYILAQVARHGPITAYELRALLAASPVGAIAGSAGAVYPVVRRLKDRALITAERVTADKRRTERLRATEAGLAGVRTWVATLDSTHLLLPDPLRSRVLFLELLAPDERLDWLRSLRRALTVKLDELSTYRETGADLWDDLANLNARGALEARLHWVNRAILAILEA